MTQTNSITQAIVTALNYRGHLAHRNNTTGVYDAKLKLFRKTVNHTALGVGDVLCVLKGGYWLEIEIKSGRDKQNANQVLRQERVERAGGLYWLVRSFDEFEKLYHRHILSQLKL